VARGRTKVSPYAATDKGLIASELIHLLLCWRIITFHRWGGCVGHLALQRDVAEHVQEESAAPSRAALLDHLLGGVG
jgi:hypothetical protein